jgi:hypothetical protein
VDLVLTNLWNSNNIRAYCGIDLRHTFRVCRHWRDIIHSNSIYDLSESMNMHVSRKSENRDPLYILEFTLSAIVIQNSTINNILVPTMDVMAEMYPA